MINPFFKNIGPININEILRNVGVNNNLKKLVTSIADVKDLANATNKDITFFHSKKYESVASTTKASYCITTKQLSNILPQNCEAIEVNNVLVSTSIITKMFYPDSVTDDFDDKTLNIEKTSFEKSDFVNVLYENGATFVDLDMDISIERYSSTYEPVTNVLTDADQRYSIPSSTVARFYCDVNDLAGVERV